MTSFPSFSSFSFQGAITGSGESLDESNKEKKKQSQIAAVAGHGKVLDTAGMVSSGSELEEEEVLKKLKRKKKKEKKKKLKKLLENGGAKVEEASLNYTSNIKILANDCYIDPNGDFNNLKFANRNQPIPAYRPPKPTRSFNPSLFRTSTLTNTIIKRINNNWVISGLNDVDSGRASMKLILTAQVEPIYLARGKGAHDNKNIMALDYIELSSYSLDTEEQLTQSRITEEEGVSAEFMEKCRLADRLVTKSPNTIEYWVDFIHLQDEMALGIVEQASNALKKRIHEKKIAIVERGLDENPTSDVLLSILLDLKSEDLDSRQMLGLWDTTLEKKPSSFCLWRSYLDFRTSNATSFSLQSILEAFEECLEKISFLSSTQGRDEKLIFFISRLCTLFKAMGYVERAIALFQALIELNCRSPPEMYWPERIGLFEDFWDSEHARFGDLGAKGWTSYKSGTYQEESTVPKSDYRQFEHINDPYTRWKLQETCYKSQQWQPLRNSIQDEIDDPFQTVVYQDIEPFLVQLFTAKGKTELIGAFLSFLQMPNSQVVSSHSLMRTDHFLYQDFDNSVLLDTFLKKETSSTLLSMSFPLSFYPAAVDGLFGDGISWPTTLGSSHWEMLQEFGSGYTDFICQILEQSLDFLPANSDYLLWAQSISNPKQAEKSAKKILKSQPMNLSLWNVYAQLVLKLKGKDEARKIYQTTLSMYKSFPEHHHTGVGVLYANLAVLEWEMGMKESAIRTLVAHSEKVTPSSTALAPEKIASARHVLLEGAIDEILVLIRKGDPVQNVYSKDMTNILHLLQNAALIEYLVSGDLQSIVDIYNRALGLIEEKSLLQELVYQMFVHLLVRILQSGAAFKPALVRSVLEEALSLFPSNTLLLSVFGMTEGKSKLDARMRRFLNSHLSKTQSLSLHLFGIWTEIHQSSSTNQSVIRSRISQATHIFHSNPSVWILAINLEADLGRKKTLFYSAIASCPFSKGLYLMAFGQLRSCFTADELEEIYEIMDDKEIRILQPLES